MISYIKGTLVFSTDNHIVVETGGMGYRIFVSSATLGILPSLGSDVKIFTYMNVKEDGISLYGFSTLEEQEIFYKLLTVSGVGPKGALGFLSKLSPQDIIMAVISDDVKSLSQAPGVGKKTAQRVILELKDKFSTEDVVGASFFENGQATGEMGGVNAKLDTVEALTALGYSKSEAVKAVGMIWEDGLSVESALKLALGKMMKF